MLPEYVQLLEALAERVPIFVNVRGESDEAEAKRLLPASVIGGARFFDIPTREPWCCDYGPFHWRTVGRGAGERTEGSVCFRFDGWGGRYDGAATDQVVAPRMAEASGRVCESSDLVLEGGAIDGNGNGVVLAARGSIVDEKRNTGWSQEGVEAELRRCLGISQVIWIDGCLEGDDTDGHVDTLCRFASERRVLACAEVVDVARLMAQFQSCGLHELELVELPLPDGFSISPGEGFWEEVAPASYANFVLANGVVTVPTFGQPETDLQAQRAIGRAFPGWEVIGLPSRRLIWGLGSFHCLTHPLPA